MKNESPKRASFVIARVVAPWFAETIRETDWFEKRIGLKRKFCRVRPWRKFRFGFMSAREKKFIEFHSLSSLSLSLSKKISEREEDHRILFSLSLSKKIIIDYHHGYRFFQRCWLILFRFTCSDSP